jgi:hypothetical protein
MTALMIESFPAGTGADDIRLRQCVSVASTDPNVLLHILRPEVHLAIWHRDTSSIFSERVLRKLTQTAPFTAVAEGYSDNVVDVLSKQLPSRPSGDLRWDLIDLALGFAAINDGGDEPLRIRLDAQSQGDCSPWQAGGAGLRMLCTYCGPGIEWLSRSGGEAEAKVANTCVDHASPIRLAAGAVAILKSDGYPGNAGNGCVHRSPRITPQDGVRLHICIDQPGWSPTDES